MTKAILKRRQLLFSGASAGVMMPLARGAAATPAAAAAPAHFPPRPIAARLLPVPDTVSPALQARIAAPYPQGWNVIPKTASAWKALAAQSAAEVAPILPTIRQRFGLQVERTRLAGVPLYLITPDTLPPANRDRLLVHLHGGGYVLYPGEAGAGEGMLMAGYGRFRVISIDYRMAPDFPFPAALDDAIAVWRALLERNDPGRMAVFGSSSGGGLTLAMVLRAKAENLPLPAAIAPGTPWSDLTGDGDSLRANAFVDNVLVSPSGWISGAAKLYAAGRDLRDPLLSPLYGDFRGFPPTILTSGTRDLFLSDTVRVHQKLRQARVTAALQVLEGQSHAQFLDPFVPETKAAFEEIGHFLGQHL